MDWEARDWPGGASDAGAIKTVESTVQCYTTGYLSDCERLPSNGHRAHGNPSKNGIGSNFGRV